MNISRTFCSNISFVALLYLFVTPVNAYYSGNVGFSGNPDSNLGADCNACHNVPLTGIPLIAPNAVLTGPKVVLADSTNHYVLTMTGGQKKGGGFNASVQKGQFIIPADYEFRIRDEAVDPKFPKELTQIAGRFVNIDPLGTLIWEFDWKAPADIGKVTMFASVLSTSNSRGKDGDISTAISLDIDVAVTLPTPIPPVAAIEAPKSADINSVIAFSGINSSDDDGNIVSYSWNFGDGVSADTNNATHTFQSLGMHTVKLTVTDNSDKTNTSFVDILIVDTASGDILVPIAVITLPQNAQQDKMLQFDALQSSSTVASYLWDFGDGVIEHSFAPDTVVSHTYTSAKTYTVTLAVQEGSYTGITSTIITVSNPSGNGGGGKPPPVRTGELIYKTECESCHGVAGIGKNGVGGAKKIKGATTLLIQNSITTTVPEMVSIVLQSGDAELLATFLSAGAGTTGDSIFITKCELCHGIKGKAGAIGAGASNKIIQNAKQQKILNAINQTSTPKVPYMQGIVISAADATLVEQYLNTTIGPVETGQTLYDNLCLSCHGAMGTGGSAKIIVNATLNMVNTAILNIQAMNAVTVITALTPVQRQKIVEYLKSGTGTIIPGDPIKGEVTYKAKCQMCHGTGTGGLAIGILNASVVMIENAIINIPKMQNIVLDVANNDKQNLVALLTQGPITKPTTGVELFMMYCSYCHGVDGLGGAFKNAPIKGMGITAQMIIDAYTGAEPEMTVSNLRNAGLTLSDRQAIANWLK